MWHINSIWFGILVIKNNLNIIKIALLHAQHMSAAQGEIP